MSKIPYRELLYCVFESSLKACKTVTFPFLSLHTHFHGRDDGVGGGENEFKSRSWVGYTTMAYAIQHLRLVLPVEARLQLSKSPEPRGKALSLSFVDGPKKSNKPATPFLSVI